MIPKCFILWNNKRDNWKNHNEESCRWHNKWNKLTRRKMKEQINEVVEIQINLGMYY